MVRRMTSCTQPCSREQLAKAYTSFNRQALAIRTRTRYRTTIDDVIYLHIRTRSNHKSLTHEGPNNNCDHTACCNDVGYVKPIRLLNTMSCITPRTWLRQVMHVIVNDLAL